MFCNADRGALTGTAPVTLPPERTVIEILETVEPDDEVVAGCRDLARRGYRLALDDFTWFEGAEELLALASVVKIDLRAGSRAEVSAIARRCREHDVSLLAEKVETDEELTWALGAGFDLFQGYAIERPSLVHGHDLSPSVLTQAQLAATVLSEDLDFDQLEDILRREPGLVVQLLQLASLGSDRGLRREVSTVREALVLLGTVRIRQWMALTMLSGRGQPAADGLATALVRARTCELLSQHRAGLRPDVAFTAGLLSALDLLLGAPREELSDRLELSDDLREAAFERIGPLGALVQEVVDGQHALEAGESVEPHLAAATAVAFTWSLAYLEALEDLDG